MNVDSESIREKKLLILGANPETAEIVNIARKMGVYTIVTDYNPAAPAKSVANEAYDIDCMDVDALEELARSLGVDGVMVGVADTLLKPYSILCERLGFPCTGTPHQMTVLGEKDSFKRLCSEFGIAGVREFHSGRNGASDEIVEYPVIIKPVDNCSGKGIALCQNHDEMIQGIEKARARSKSGRIMIEQYMECDDLIAYYTIVDGIVSLSMLGDRFTYRKSLQHSPVCIADIYPSKHLDEYVSVHNVKFVDMLESIGVRNGVFLVQMFYENNQPFVYDPGFRLQGGAQHLNIEAVNGFDQREMLIHFALTGDMGLSGGIVKVDDVSLGGKCAGSLWFLLRAGIIGQIEGMSHLSEDKDIVNVLQRFDVGDEVTEDMEGTEQQVFARVHFISNDRVSFKEKIEQLLKSIKVVDQHGENMLLWGDFTPASVLMDEQHV